MPVPAEWRYFYLSPEWRTIRARILKRAGGKFDQTGKYLGGAQCEKCGREDYPGVRGYALQVAHLDHNQAHNGDHELAALCGRCHLRHDADKHRETRCIRKDAARPLIAPLSREGVI